MTTYNDWRDDYERLSGDPLPDPPILLGQQFRCRVCKMLGGFHMDGCDVGVRQGQADTEYYQRFMSSVPTEHLRAEVVRRDGNIAKLGGPVAGLTP